MAKKPKRLIDKDALFAVVKKALEKHGLLCPDNLEHAYHLCKHPQERLDGGYDALGLHVCIEAIEGSELDEEDFDPEIRDVDRAVGAIIQYIVEIDSVVDALENLGVNTPLPPVRIKDRDNGHG